MKFATTSLLTLSLAGTSLAGFEIVSAASSWVSWSNSEGGARYTSIANAYSSALTSYAAEVTKMPEWSSAWDEVYSFQATRTDVPAIVTATNRETIYTTTPEWFKAMPTDAQKFFGSMFAKQDAIYASAAKQLDSGAAAAGSRSTGVMVCGALVAGLVGAVGVM